MASAPLCPPSHRRRPAPVVVSMTLAQRRALTAELLKLAAECSAPAARHGYLVEVVRLNIAVADAIADRYRHHALDACELREHTRQALLQAVTAFDPAQGPDLMTYVVPLVHQAAQAHVRSRRASVRDLDDPSTGSVEDPAIDDLVGQLDLDEKGAATVSVVLHAGDPDGDARAVLGPDRGARLVDLVRRLPSRQRLLLCLELLASHHSRTRGPSPSHPTGPSMTGDRVVAEAPAPRPAEPEVQHPTVDRSGGEAPHTPRSARPSPRGPRGEGSQVYRLSPAPTSPGPDDARVHDLRQP